MGAFDQSKCDLPEVTSISALPAIEDCAVPEFPFDAFLLECNDLDVIAPSGADGGDGVPGIPGPRGPTGPPGPAGASASCTCGGSTYVWTGATWVAVVSDCPEQATPPASAGSAPGQTAQTCCPWRFNAVSTYQCVFSPAQVYADVNVTPGPDCSFDYHFDFGLLCSSGVSVSACEGGASGLETITFRGNPGAPCCAPNEGGDWCCDFSVRNLGGGTAQIQLGAVRVRSATAVSNWFDGTPPQVQAEDNDTGDAIEIELPRTAFRDPNVRVGDSLLYIVTPDCRFVAVGNYMDHAVGTMLARLWDLSELGAAEAGLNARGWYICDGSNGTANTAERFLPGHPCPGSFDCIGGGTQAGSTGGRRTHDGAGACDHQPHAFSHGHFCDGFGCSTTPATLMLGGAINSVVTEPAKTLIEVRDPGSMSVQHMAHLHNYSASEQSWNHPTPRNFSEFEGWTEGDATCNDKIPTSKEKANDCDETNFVMTHQVEETEHVHTVSATGLRLNPETHGHKFGILPKSLLAQHSEENHIPPYLAIVFIERRN